MGQIVVAIDVPFFISYLHFKTCFLSVATMSVHQPVPETHLTLQRVSTKPCKLMEIPTLKLIILGHPWDGGRTIPCPVEALAASHTDTLCNYCQCPSFTAFPLSSAEISNPQNSIYADFVADISEDSLKLLLAASSILPPLSTRLYFQKPWQPHPQFTSATI